MKWVRRLVCAPIRLYQKFISPCLGHNFRFLPGRMLAVTDADGNRYRITNVDTLDKASYKRLLLFI